MQDLHVTNGFSYESAYKLKGHSLEKIVYFDFYNGEWVGYLANDAGKKVCMITSASKIYVDSELEAFDTIDAA